MISDWELVNVAGEHLDRISGVECRCGVLASHISGAAEECKGQRCRRFFFQSRSSPAAKSIRRERREIQRWSWRRALEVRVTQICPKAERVFVLSRSGLALWPGGIRSRCSNSSTSRTGAPASPRSPHSRRNRAAESRLGPRTGLYNRSTLPAPTNTGGFLPPFAPAPPL